MLSLSSTEHFVRTASTLIATSKVWGSNHTATESSWVNARQKPAGNRLAKETRSGGWQVRWDRWRAAGVHYGVYPSPEVSPAGIHLQLFTWQSTLCCGLFMGAVSHVQLITDTESARYTFLLAVHFNGSITFAVIICIIYTIFEFETSQAFY